MSASKRLSIYLNDHLAGAVAGLELAKRARGSNEEGELGAFLERLVEEIEADKRTLEGVMDELEIGRDRPKLLFGWTTEKLGRLKLNGQLSGYSPLSRMLELEGLVVGVTAKEALWRALRELSAAEPRLDAALLDSLAERAQRQRRELDEQRLRAAREALRG